MKKVFNQTFILVLALLILSSFVKKANAPVVSFPYQQFSLTKRQAATHLLNRFTYGATQADIDAVVKIGLENWFRQQLLGNLPDKDLQTKLAVYDAINLSNTEAENTYPRNAQLINLAVKSGYLNKDSVNKAEDNKAYKEKIQALMREKGYKPQQELFRQLINQKILRAIYTQNQLQEVMTDFWFNHFNVSLSKNQCAIYVPAFERDVIRPNVFGNFEALLLATAKSPAMLMYLDNFSSSGANVPMQNTIAGGNRKLGLRKMQTKLARNKQGLNENYAREVMELHTLGVEGGYTQADVTQAARILTGWTLAPMGDNGYGAAVKKITDRIGEDNLEKNGFVLEGDFMFVANRHDNAEKIVLGKKFPAGGGYDEGIELLKMLAHHTSTAQFIVKKIATRFVSDNPPQTLIDKMSKTFLSSKGNIKSVLIAMVNAPEFWAPNAIREKTKSPFEFAISAVRVLNASVNQPYQLYNWVTKMGQQIYHYQAPTGFPDKGQYWINTGSLLSRMNFGLALAAHRIPGISFDLIALNNNHEPESSEVALTDFSEIFMPERKLDETIRRLKPMLNDPDLQNKVAKAATQHPPSMPINMETESKMMEVNPVEKLKDKKVLVKGNNTIFSQVVGVIIGSPEFQRK